DLQPRRRLAQVVRKLLALGREGLDVAARAEVRAVAAQDDDPDARLPVAAHDRVVERAEQGHVHPVRRLRAVERQTRDAVGVEGEQHGAVGDQRVGHARALNAWMPSAADASRRCARTVARSSSSPSASDRSSPASTRCLIRRRAAGALPASLAASSSTVVSSASAGTARYASPHAAASDPVSRSPVSMCASARCRPTMRGSRCEPPPPGTWPKLAWLSASRASSATIAMSHACRSSKPPAIAWPWTAAITGTGTSRTAAQAARKLSNSSASAPSPASRNRSSSWKSPPTQKLPPAPRITITRASSPSRRTARSSSRPRATVIAFIASGRLRTMRPTPSGWVTRTSDVATRSHDRHERDAGPRLAAQVVRQPERRIGELAVPGLITELLPALEEHPQPAGADRMPEALEAAGRVDGTLAVLGAHDQRRGGAVRHAGAVEDPELSSHDRRARDLLHRHLAAELRALVQRAVAVVLPRDPRDDLLELVLADPVLLAVRGSEQREHRRGRRLRRGAVVRRRRHDEARVPGVLELLAAHRHHDVVGPRRDRVARVAERLRAGRAVVLHARDRLVVDLQRARERHPRRARAHRPQPVRVDGVALEARHRRHALVDRVDEQVVDRAVPVLAERRAPH